MWELVWGVVVGVGVGGSVFVFCKSEGLGGFDKKRSTQSKNRPLKSLS